VCVRVCVVCLPMYAGEIDFFLATLFAFCLEQVERSSANNVACGFIN